MVKMGKISPVSAKYIVHSFINIEGVVDRPDIIGAVFGQTEGLLGNELELRELQRSGRIGRIEVNIETKAGKTSGSIIIPSSLDKAETAIVGASLETIQRIGPCNAKVRVQRIEDIRISKRSYVLERAKELLRTLTDSVLPDSQEMTDEVAQSVRMMEIKEYGKDRLAAGPAIDESDEVIVVEGRADVLNLLKHGFKNVIAMNGTNVPQTIIDLSRKKEITVFVDGDKGGELIIREISSPPLSPSTKTVISFFLLRSIIVWGTFVPFIAITFLKPCFNRFKTSALPSTTITSSLSSMAGPAANLSFPYSFISIILTDCATSSVIS